MIPHYPTLGIRFTIAKLDGGYGDAAWLTFWRTIDPGDIKNSLLFEGDTRATLAHREDVFCIAIQNDAAEVLARVKKAFLASEEFLRVAAVPAFIEGAACTSEPLPDTGRIDLAGDLVGAPSTARRALGVLLRERATAAPQAALGEVKPLTRPASERTRNLPSISSFDELGPLLGKLFMASEYPKDLGIECWLTAEEVAEIAYKYADHVLISHHEWPVPISMDYCHIRMDDKSNPRRFPIQFSGFFPFGSLQDARNFGKDWSSVPVYANALPRLAGVRGKYHMNFQYKCENWRDNDSYMDGRPKTGLTPDELWEFLSRRKDRFLADLQKTEGGRVAADVHQPNLARSATAAAAKPRRPWWKFWG